MARFDADRFFTQACQDGLPERVLQFRSYITCRQYDTAYATTLRHVPAGSEVLDWGCGNGHFSYFLHAQGLRVTGYSFDPPPPFLVGRPGYEFVGGRHDEPTALPFAQARFDCVFSVGVLEHVHETGGSEAASLREINRVLRPGGLFLCFHFPNRYQWIEALARALRLRVHTHARTFTATDIGRLCAGAGFTVEAIGRYNFLPRNPLIGLPDWARRSRWLGKAFCFADRLLSLAFPLLCTNFFFVARKIGAPEPSEQPGAPEGPSRT